jgi:WD40 repeat protein
LIDDCERFVLGFFDVIEMSAMHIYHSALPWSPTSSPTRKLYQRQMKTEVKLVNATDAQWDACIRTIPVPNSLIAIMLSQNGSALAVVSEKDVKIFETATGVATFKVDECALSVAFSLDGDMLVCGCGNSSVRVWDVQTSNLVQLFEGHVDKVFSVAFSPSGTMIASGSRDRMVRIWDMSSRRCASILAGHLGSVWAVCWSGTGDRVVSGSGDNSIRIWNISTRTCLRVLRAHTKLVTSVAFSCDCSLVVSGSWDRTAKVYDARTGNVLQTIPTNATVYSVRFSTNGDKLLYTNWGKAIIWDLSGKVKMSTTDYDGYCAAFTPDGARVASGSDGFVKIWNTEIGYSTSDSETVNHHSGEIDAIVFAPDGRVMVSRSWYNVKIWDTNSGNCLFTFDPHLSGKSIVFSPGSAFVARWSDDSYAQVWDVHNRTLVKDVQLDVEEGYSNVALSPCGGRLVSQSSSQTILWDLGSGKRLACLDFDSPFLRESQITFDGTSVFIHYGDDIIQCWRVSPARFSNHCDDSFSDSNQFTSLALPLVFIPMQENSPHQITSVPKQHCRYEGDEWILDDNRKRILWLPPDRRGLASASKCHGKKIAIGTYPSGRVYVADFSDALLLS